MMRIVFACALLACAANALPVPLSSERSELQSPFRQSSALTISSNLDSSPSACKGCIQASVVAINEILNAVLNEGVVGGCEDLCGKLPEKAEQVVCDAVCIGLGVYEFVKLLERKGGPDPIYYCQLAHMCKVDDCTGDCADVETLGVSPASGKKGTNFVVAGNLNVTKASGAGMTRITLYIPDPKEMPQEQDALNTNLDPGSYGLQIGVDSSQFPVAGNYTLEVKICEGMCDLDYPHTRTFSAKNVTFTVTE
mmetsp:Transcript_119296/g.178220  ORF Transcript_119296/g.178220 Transcript_119296/m.178220 type:complete len:252 (+) Transcript_119296:3-758(+)